MLRGRTNDTMLGVVILIYLFIHSFIHSFTFNSRLKAHAVEYRPNGKNTLTVKINKNSSGDEIANVNFLRRYGTYVLQNTKKENLLPLTN